MDIVGFLLNPFLDRCIKLKECICAHPQHKAVVLRSHFAAKYLKYCDRKLDKTASSFFHRSIVGCSCQENALQRGDAWCSAKCILPFQWCHNCCNIELLTTCTSVKTDGYSFNATNVQRWVSLYVWALSRVNMFPTVTQNSKLDLFQNENNSKLKLCPIFAKKLFYFRFRASYQKTLHQYMVVTMLKAIWLAIWGHQQVVESNITFFAYWWWWWQWRRDVCTIIHQRLKCKAFPMHFQLVYDLYVTL